MIIKERTKMLTEDRIYDAYNGKVKAVEELATCIEQIATLKSNRAIALAQKVADGLYADCKNEDARKAAASVAMSGVDELIANWEKSERAARLAYDVACIDVSMVNALLELSKSVK